MRGNLGWGTLSVADNWRHGKARIRRGVAQLTDWLYPPRCLACPDPTETPMGLCGNCWRETHFLAGCVCDLCGMSVPSAEGFQGRVLCESCTSDPPGWDRGRAAVVYEGVGQRVVLGLKHGDRLDCAPTLARWMTGAGARIIEEDMLLLPIPLHWRRQLGRRYNQAAVLARAVAARGGLECRTDLLLRPEPTLPQTGTREDRQGNLRGKITLADGAARTVSGRHVLLIDDVMTTGATLAAATEAVRAGGADKVSVLVLARVAKAQ